MGQKIYAQTKERRTTSVDTFLMKYYPELQYMCEFSNGLFTKSAVIRTETDEPLVLKIFFKRDAEQLDEIIFEKVLKKTKDISHTIKKNEIYNIAPILLLENTSKAVMLFHQLYAYSLKQRRFLMPYLTYIEKVFISFQILFAVNELHIHNIKDNNKKEEAMDYIEIENTAPQDKEKGEKMCHGDLQMNNIYITSLGSVFLGDICPYKPAFLQSDDLIGYTYYFGSDGKINKNCYLAPERLVSKNEYEEKVRKDEVYKLTPEMDIFSAGLVIGELFAEDSFLDYTKLLNLKKGEYSFDTILKEVKNDNLRELLKRMLEVDPAKRISLTECLQFFSLKVCPISIPRMLIHLNTIITTTSYYKPDMLIGCIYKHWRQIWKMLFGLNESNECPVLYQKLNFMLVNKLITTPSFKIPNLKRTSHKFILRNYELMFNLEDFSELLDEKSYKDTPKIFLENNNQECIIFIINYLKESLFSTKYESSFLVGIELMKHLALRIPDLKKIQIVIPYYIEMIKVKDNLGKLTAFHYLMEILCTINFEQLVLPMGEFNFFDDYVFPALLSLIKYNDLTLILEFTNVIDDLYRIEERCLACELRSRLLMYNYIQDNIPNEVNSEKNQIQAKPREKLDKIYKKYDMHLEDFKDKIFNIIEEVISKFDQIDVLQILTRKMPALINIYGTKKKDDFARFINTNFNQKGWILQREILRYIPLMIDTLGKETFQSFILPCIEGLASNNFNEHVISELLSTITKLIDEDYIDLLNIVSITRNLLPYLVHPNIKIRNNLKKLIPNLMRKLGDVGSYKFLYAQLTPYISINFFAFTPDIIENYTKEHISRWLYEINKHGINYQSEIENNSLSCGPLVSILERQRAIMEMDDYTDDYILIKEKEKLRLPEDFIKEKCLTLIDPLHKEYKKFMIKAANSKMDINDENGQVTTIFLGKIFWYTDSLAQYSLPETKTNHDLIFKEDDSPIAQKQFRMIYLLKTLQCEMKLFNLNELIEEEIPRIPKRTITVREEMLGWKLQGRLISTLYNQKNLSFERLIPGGSNQFTSVDSSGIATVWEIDRSNEDSYSIKQIADFVPKIPLKISYNHSISFQYKDNFVLGAGNKLYKYVTVSGTNPFNAISNIFTAENDNNITCSRILGADVQESEKIILGTENGKLNIIDPRMPKEALICQIPLEKGMVNCMSEPFSNFIYLGTLGGYIIKYDFRINELTQSYKYKNNIPIIGLSNYYPIQDRLREYVLPSLYDSKEENNFLTVWTEQEDHEIALWNINSLNCDVLFKVNKIYGKNHRSLTVDIPIIEQEKFESDSSLKDSFIKLRKITNKFDKSYYKNLSFAFSEENYFKNADQILTKLTNLYEKSSTVQVVCSPLGTLNRMNVPYFISAGNDMTIRFWDISKEGINQREKNSFLISSPDNINKCVFTKVKYNNTIILQSNETYDIEEQRKESRGLAEFHYYNGVSYNSAYQNDFNKSMNNLRFAKRIADAAHKSCITDVLPLLLNDNSNLLLSSSWDGTVKVWK